MPLAKEQDWIGALYREKEQRSEWSQGDCEMRRTLN